MYVKMICSKVALCCWKTKSKKNKKQKKKAGATLSSLAHHNDKLIWMFFLGTLFSSILSLVLRDETKCGECFDSGSSRFSLRVMEVNSFCAHLLFFNEGD